MSRKLSILALATGLVIASGSALADHDTRYEASGDRYGRHDDDGEYEYARVTHVEPLRRQVRVSEPVEECRDKARYAPQGPFSANHIRGTLFGGLIGTALGNQIGHGRGKDVARAAGAILGGAIGHNVSRDREWQRHGNGRRVYARCDVRYRERWEERVDGYEVNYEYAGRDYVTRMPYDPGDRIRVRVDVSPAGA